MASAQRVQELVAHLRPRLRHRVDALAFAVHTACLAEGCRLVGLSDAATAAAGGDSGSGLEPNADGWNASPDHYCFKYRVRGASQAIVLKMVVLGASLHVHAVQENSNVVHSLELSVDDYVIREADLASHDKVYRNLQAFITILKERILSKVIPRSPPSDASRGIPAPAYDPLRMPPLPTQPHSGGDFGGDVIPPFPPFPGIGDHPGNIMGPDHPIFGGRGRGRRMGPRFDPFGPGGHLGQDPDRDHLPPPGRGGGNNFPF